jgi:hypothetical protein
MAFEGHLVELNGLVLPSYFIAIESYKITPDQVQDEDDYIDGNGKLHRNTLPHTRSKMEFNTPPLNESQVRAILSYMPNTISMSVRYWNPKTGVYKTGTFYVPDLDFTIRTANNTDIYYNPVRIALIEY